MSPASYAWLVLLFPLLGAVTTAVGYRVLPTKVAGLIATTAIGAAFLSAVGTLVRLLSYDPEHRQHVSKLWEYFKTGTLHVDVAILVDPLSVTMICVVTGVSFLIHLYSTTYMDSDKGYTRFFSYLNLFVFSMLLLVLAANFFLLIVGWALVGAASYLLISYWYRRETATKAGVKAFVINVLGDVGLVLGTFFIVKSTGTLDFIDTFEHAEAVFGKGNAELTAGCILLLVGAFAKSAQAPLHTWLPDAMEGPTPVSALIHAATMVTAGVYLIARLHPLFELAPAAANVGAVVGCATLLIAATIGLVVTDLKRVIAYSTMSQIGYMVMAVSTGAYAAGMFHLVTHAFFKALLFMAAGSVIAAMAGVQSLDKMSGFRRAMPFTFGCFIVGGLALAGVPPLSGFFSKDEILLVIGSRGGWFTVLYIAGYVGALFTAIYTFRMIFRAFLGEPCAEAKELEAGHLHHADQPTNPVTGQVEDTEVGYPGSEHHIAERSKAMKTSMGLLALLAITAGVLQIPHVTNYLHSFLEPTFAHSELYEEQPSDSLLVLGLVLGAVVAVVGIGIAYFLYVKSPNSVVAVRERFPRLHRLFERKWFFDEAIDLLVVRPVRWFGHFCNQRFERFIINGLIIGGSLGVVRVASAAVRVVQNGMIRLYVALLTLSTVLILLFLLVR